jgi:rubredoxin
MATMRCQCGTILRDDDPDYSLLLFTWRQFDVDVNSEVLRGRARAVWRCRTCGRLWVFWEHLGDPTEYVATSGRPMLVAADGGRLAPIVGRGDE